MKELIGKTYRCKTAIPHRIYNDVQPGSAVTDIYIYDKQLVLSYFTYAKGTDEYLIKSNNQTNKFEPVDRKQKTKNLIQRIEDGTDSSVRNYQVDNNEITVIQKNNEGQDELRFKGEILLKGDAIRGIDYNKGKQVTPMRVYYNVEKPLPNILIPEGDNDGFEQNSGM